MTLVFWKQKRSFRILKSEFLIQNQYLFEYFSIEVKVQCTILDPNVLDIYLVDIIYQSSILPFWLSKSQTKKLKCTVNENQEKKPFPALDSENQQSINQNKCQLALKKLFFCLFLASLILEHFRILSSPKNHQQQTTRQTFGIAQCVGFQ